MVVGKDERDQIDPSDRVHAARLIEVCSRADAVPAIETCNPTLEPIRSHRSVSAYRSRCVKGLEAPRGRDRLREALAGFGFAVR
jgi:hypothetical protein